MQAVFIARARYAKYQIRGPMAARACKRDVALQLIEVQQQTKHEQCLYLLPLVHPVELHRFSHAVEGRNDLHEIREAEYLIAAQSDATPLAKCR